MLPELPRELYLHSGPFASVYVDVSRDHQNSPHEIELRWKELARSLVEQGADDADIRAIEEVFTEPTGQAGSAGRAVIASGGQVRLDVALPDRPRREIARWATLPHVMPLLAQTPEPLPHVVISLGRTSATVRAVDADGAVSQASEHAQEEGTHKVRGADRDKQSYTEEVWAKNVRGFARTVDDTVAHLHAQLVVITGDVRARTILLDELGERSRSLAAEVDGADPDDTTTHERISGKIEDLLARRAAQRSREVLDGVNVAHGRDAGLAASGLGPVVAALQQAQVETLVIQDDPSSALELWIGAGARAPRGERAGAAHPRRGGARSGSCGRCAGAGRGRHRRPAAGTAAPGGGPGPGAGGQRGRQPRRRPRCAGGAGADRRGRRGPALLHAGRLISVGCPVAHRFARPQQRCPGA